MKNLFAFLVGLLASLLLFLLLSTPAEAQGIPCSNDPNAREDFATQLFEDYGETPIGVGLSSTNVFFEIWTNPETRTWTIIITQANGTVCMLAEGGDYNVVNVPQGEPM